MKTTEEEKAESLKELRAAFPRGATVYSVFRHRSASNMTGWYSFVGIPAHQGESRKEERKPTLWHPNWAIANVTGYARAEKRGHICLKVCGCGFNRPAAVVGSLAYALYGREDALRHESI